jgi:hypothetical protein
LERINTIPLRPVSAFVLRAPMFGLTRRQFGDTWYLPLVAVEQPMVTRHLIVSGANGYVGGRLVTTAGARAHRDGAHPPDQHDDGRPERAFHDQEGKIIRADGQALSAARSTLL